MARKAVGVVDSEPNDGLDESCSVLDSITNSAEYKKDHLNFAKRIDYKVSTGSLLLDIATAGGFGPGVHRFSGISGGGKTSQILAIMKNFFKKFKDSKAVFVDAEGRLSEEMKKRSGVTFVYDVREWVKGTCYVLITNKYEIVAALLDSLINNNESELKYFFVIDSLDGLIMKASLEKKITDQWQVGGTAKITKQLLQRIGVYIGTLGHMAFFTGQVSAEIRADTYTPKDKNRLSNTSGGNAIVHYSNIIWEFYAPRVQDDFIPKDHSGPANPLLGHWATIMIRKDGREQQGKEIRYPIKRNQKDGSIWVAYEVYKGIFNYGYLIKKGAWCSFRDTLRDKMTAKGLDVPVQIQGENKVIEFLETNKAVTDFLYQFLYDTECPIDQVIKWGEEVDAAKALAQPVAPVPVEDDESMSEVSNEIN